jgi:hypothetical protein
MLDLLIYHLHIVGVLYAAVKRWQHEGLKGAVLAVAICGLVFMIGWSLTGTVARLIMTAPAQPGDWFTVDTLSLVLLFVPEVLFFWMFFVRDRDAKVRNVTSQEV